MEKLMKFSESSDNQHCKTQNTKKLIRLAVYLIGLVVLALGNICSVISGLGVTATASIGYVLSELTGFSLGTMTIITFVIFVIIQLLVTNRRNYVQILLQLPFSLFFSYMIDFLFLVIRIDAETAVMQWTLMFLGIVFTSIGVVFTVGVQIVPTAPDGVVQTLSERLQMNFGNMKNLFDLTMVVLAVVLGFAFRGCLMGVGIGTVISALLIGRVVKVLEGRIAPFMKKLTTNI